MDMTNDERVVERMAGPAGHRDLLTTVSWRNMPQPNMYGIKDHFDYEEWLIKTEDPVSKQNCLFSFPRPYSCPLHGEIFNRALNRCIDLSVDAVVEYRKRNMRNKKICERIFDFVVGEFKYLLKRVRI